MSGRAPPRRRSTRLLSQKKASSTIDLTEGAASTTTKTSQNNKSSGRKKRKALVSISTDQNVVKSSTADAAVAKKKVKTKATKSTQKAKASKAVVAAPGPAVQQVPPSMPNAINSNPSSDPPKRVARKAKASGPKPAEAAPTVVPAPAAPPPSGFASEVAAARERLTGRRGAAFAVRLAQELADIDEFDRGNPLACHEYAAEIHQNNMILEAEMPRNGNYLATVQRHLLTPKVRAILVDWLVEVALEFDFRNETLYNAVALVDRSLAKFRVAKADLQLLGCAALLLASKYEEVVTRSVDDFVYVSDSAYDSVQICEMELKICQQLDFTLTVPTQLSFLDRFLHIDRSLSAKQKMFARYVSELALVQYTMLPYKASIVAASCVCLAKRTVGCGKKMVLDPWPDILAYESTYTIDMLIPCILTLHQLFIKDSSRVKPERLTGTELFAVQEKYTHGWSHFIAKQASPVENLSSWLVAYSANKAQAAKMRS